MGARSKASVYGRSLAGTTGSNHRLRHECLSVVKCCQVDVSATGRSFAQRSPTGCGVSECGPETSHRKPRLTSRLSSQEKECYSLQAPGVQSIHLEGPGVGGRIILRWIFRKWDVGHGRDRCGSGQGQVASTCEYGNEPSGSIKCWEFLD